MAAPQCVKSILGGGYSAIPVSWRRGKNYEQFRQIAFCRDETLNNNYVKSSLGETLSWAVRTVPAYLGVANPEECKRHPEMVLASMPLLTKAEIKLDLNQYLSNAISENRRLRTYTGGSTAEPMMFYLQKGITRAREYAFMDDFHVRVGLTDTDIILALRGRTIPGAEQSDGRIWMYEPIKRQLILSSDHLIPEYMPDYVKVLLKMRPSYIQAFPSALYPLARWLDSHPEHEVTEKIRGVFLYSENVYGYQMELIRKVFSCPVLIHYGHSERVLMAASMPDDDRYFFWPQYGYVELIDEEGQAITMPNKLGEIVGTSFNNQVMPFIRYRTGDMAMWSTKPEHPELPGFKAVERVEGRLQEFIVCRDRRLVSICTMGAAHFEDLVVAESIQFEQIVAGHFIIKVVARASLDENARARIKSAVEEKTQGGCTAEVIEVAEIPRTKTGKHVMLIQHLHIDNYSPWNY